MKQVLKEEQFAAFIGIDWADTKHDLCLQAAGCDNRAPWKTRPRKPGHPPVYPRPKILPRSSPLGPLRNRSGKRIHPLSPLQPASTAHFRRLLNWL